MYNPFSLVNKTILVTGASSGIGRGIAIECSKMGAKLVLSGRNLERLAETQNRLEGEGHICIEADLTEESGINNLVQQCPLLDGCVHCAGMIKLTTIKSVRKDIVDKIFNTNTISSIVLTSGLLKKKKIQNGASIVFLSSLSGVFITNTGESLYSATKGAISGFAKGAAYELSSRKIRVNCVNPWAIDTSEGNVDAKNIFSEILDYSSMGEGDENPMDKLINRSPLKRLGTPSDVAYGVIYLLSDAASWVTGTNLVIDGGYTLT